jgi:maleate isomerase
MLHVSDKELRDMDAQAERCVIELSDAQCDVLVYACLVAVMVQGPGAHERIECRLTDIAQNAGSNARLISSAGALVDSLRALNASRVAIVTPYVPALAAKVIDYLGGENIEVTAVQNLGVDDNQAVGRIHGSQVLDAVQKLDLSNVDALVLSACVQMPSLGILDEVRQVLDLPVLTAASATADSILRDLSDREFATK